ncbi:MAG: hypothetical protein ACRD6X_09950 [Pyrinomonadaceae bacterium]
MSIPDIDQTYRMMVIIWLVLLLTQFALFGMAYSFFREASVANEEFGFLSANPPIIIGALLLAFTNFALSFVIGRRCQVHAVDEQNVKPLMTGLVIGCALCESISLIGMALLAVFAYPYFQIFFAFGILGIILHFPRKKQLVDATFSKTA